MITYNTPPAALGAGVAQLVGASSCNHKGCGFEPGQGTLPRLWVQSAQLGTQCGRQPINQCLSLTAVFSLSLKMLG